MFILQTAAIALCFALLGCQRKLPEPDSYAARLYQNRCGQCHQLYDPRSLTAAMWYKQLEMMQAKIRQAGMPPLSPGEHRAILDYLDRNSSRE